MVVLPRSLSPRLRVFVRLEESAGAHCPSLSPVSAPFLRNARHFLPSPVPSLPLLFLFLFPPLSLSLSFTSLLYPLFLVPFYFSFSFFLCVYVYKPPCSLPFSITLAVCSLFGLFGPRKYHLPPPPPNFVRSSPFFCIAAWEKFFFSFFLEISNTLDFLAFFATTLSRSVCGSNDTLLARFFKRPLIDSLNVRVFCGKHSTRIFSRRISPSKKRERIVIRRNRNKETVNLSSAPEVADTHALLWKRSKVDLRLKTFAVKANSFPRFRAGSDTFFFPLDPRRRNGVDRVHDFNQRVGSTRGAHVTLGL